MIKIRLHSDTHGKYKELFPKLLSGSDGLNIHLGDVGYDYTELEAHIYGNGISFSAIRGNHERHDLINGPQYPLFFFGEFGSFETKAAAFFYVSGAFSIDWKLRQKYYFSGKWPQTWFPEEELSIPKLKNAVALYKKTRPAVVLTHEAPRSISNMIGNRGVLRSFGFDPDTFTTRTSEALEEMFLAYQPELWVFGHYHSSFDVVVNGTRFICKPELGYTDLLVDKGKLTVLN